MSEWTIVGVIVVLVGLILSVSKPIISFNSSVLRLEGVVKTLEKTVKRVDVDNREEHSELWEAVDRTSTRQADHEVRIKLLEHINSTKEDANGNIKRL